MNVKATLICEDVRFEANGALTLVGVYNDELVAPAGDGPLRTPMFLVVVAGLRGIERIGYRQYVRRIDEPDPPQAAPHIEQHHPEADEHNFILGSALIGSGAAAAGTYELVVELQARDESLVHRYRFHIARGG